MNNERIVNGVKTRVLHNKDYVEVAERIRIVHELKKKVEMVESAPFQVLDRWIWRVVVKVDDLPYIGNAEVKLNAAKNTPDGTNPFECAETSAIGRALAFAGLGTVESIASYDEIARSQPFMAVVEEPTPKRVVNAANAPKQLAQPLTLNQRIDSTYKQMIEKGLIIPTDDKSANAVSFLEICGKAVGANITALGQLTASRMDVVEKYLVADQIAS